MEMAESQGLISVNQTFKANAALHLVWEELNAYHQESQSPHINSGDVKENSFEK